MFNEVKNDLIPYVILEAHPDYKRPYVLPYFGMIQEYRLYDFLLEKLVEFVYDRIDISNINSVKDIKYFWDHYYDLYYMDNPPWQATAIINGIWEDINPTNEDVFKKLMEIKKNTSSYISSESEDKSINSAETVESIIIDEIEEDSDDLLMEHLEFEV